MTNSSQKERFQTKIAMLEQNNQVLQNKCEEYLGELIRTKKQLEIAVDALKLFCGEDVSYYSQSKIDARDARAALEQINNIDKGE